MSVMIDLASSGSTARNSSASAPPLSINFWGVRGSVPTPALANRRYGGNTICVEVLLGEQRVIFDSGTGIVELGKSLQDQRRQKQEERTQAHLFFTHTQWDRIQGFPFFQPAFDPKNQFSIYGGTAPNGASIKHCLTDQMLKPYFSMPLQNMQANLEFHTLLDQAQFHIEDIVVQAARINASTEAFGYRLTWQDRVIVYATDTTENIEPELIEFVDSADILIYDGTYSDLTYLRCNSDESLEPWATGVNIAKQANVKQLVLLHHSPIQDDVMLDRLQAEVCDRFENTLIAKEGMSVSC